MVRANHHEGIKSQARKLPADGEHTTRQVHTLLVAMPAATGYICRNHDISVLGLVETLPNGILYTVTVLIFRCLFKSDKQLTVVFTCARRVCYMSKFRQDIY